MRSLRRSAVAGLATLAFLTFPVSVRDLAWSAHLPEQPMEGMRLFIKKGCVECHAIQGQGGTAGPDLTKLQLRGSFLGLASSMWNHLPRMQRAFKQLHIRRPKLTAEESSRIMALLYSLSFLDRLPDPRRGRNLFDAKGCRRCHSVGGAGGSVGPPLDRFGGKISPAFVTAAFWNRGLGMARVVRGRGLKWPRFRGDELTDIAAYLRAEGKPQGKARAYLKPGNPKAGQALFASKGCVQCHAVLGKGGRVGPDLGRRDLKRSLAQIAGVIWNHGPAMWEEIAKRKLDLVLKPQEMLHLLSYLYFLQYTDPPGDARAGKSVFQIKGCAHCHRAGGGRGPDLAGKELRLASKVIADMWNHGPRMEKEALQLGVMWPNITGREMVDLMAYIRSIQRPSPAKK